MRCDTKSCVAFPEYCPSLQNVGYTKGGTSSHSMVKPTGLKKELDKLKQDMPAKNT